MASVAVAHQHPVWCILYANGIVFFLAIYGMCQEGIMTVPYGHEYFHYSILLVLFNRLAALSFAAVMIIRKEEQLSNQAPLWKYLLVSMANVYASTCQYEALKYVSFTVQILGKSFKMMPVMLWGILLAGKSYALRDWVVALLVTAGTADFLLTGPTHSRVSPGNSMEGLALLGAFLLLDGLTSTLQEKLFREHRTTKYNQMMYINLISAAVSFATLVVRGDFFPALAFGMEHPRFWVDCGVLGASAVASQWCIFSQVKDFGALALAATMNVRQVVSILLSYLKYHHPVTPWQIVGLSVIFSALSFKTCAGLLPRGEKQPLLEGVEKKV